MRISFPPQSLCKLTTPHPIGNQLQLQPAAAVPDVEAGLVDRLEGREAGEEEVGPGEPRALPPPLLIRGDGLLYPDLAVPVPDPTAGPRHRLERHGSLSPQPGADDPEHLGLRHEVSLDTLVHRPVVAGTVLAADTDYQSTCKTTWLS